MGRFSWVGAWLAIASFAAGPVLAQPRGPRNPPPAQPTPAPDQASQEDAAARLLFNSAREAFAAGNYEVALQRFQQAYDLSHRSALLYNIGTTLDRMRRDREALAAFERFLAEDATSPNRSEVEARVRVLREAIEAEDARLAEQQRQQEEQQRALEEARRQAEERARLAAQQQAEDSGGGAPPVVFFSVAGATVATGIVGLAFGLRTRSLNDDYRALGEDAAMPGSSVTDAQVQSAYDDALGSQRVANAMLFTSAALAVGSVVLIFVTDWDGDPEAADEQPPAGARILPSVAAAPGEGHVGVQVRF